MEWYNIKINAQNIEHDTGKAVLIKMPNNSEYKGYYFWHPSKLVRDKGGKGYFKSISFTKKFNFLLFKKGKGKYNKNEVLDETYLSAEDILEAFGCMSDNIDNSMKAHNKKQEEEQELHIEKRIPDKIEKEVAIDEGLIL